MLKTLTTTTAEVLYKDRKSKFYGQGFPITAETDVKPILDQLRKQYKNANHVCYAWCIGSSPMTYRANDDGEPTHSAGTPIYKQIQNSNLTNTLVTVTRFFGGTKLGVGGLIQAYRTTAKLTLEAASTIIYIEECHYKLLFPYSIHANIMKILNHERLPIKAQKMEQSCELIVAIPHLKEEEIVLKFEKIYQLKVVALD